MSTRQDGPLWVGGKNETTNVVSSLELDNAGNLKVAVTGAGSGGTSSVDESAFAVGVSAGTPAMGVYEVTPSTLTDGKMGIVAVNANRELKVEVTAGGGGSSPFGSPLPASGVAIGFEDSGGDLAPVVLEADGSIPVTVIAGGGANASVSATGAAVPAEATYVGRLDGSGNLAGLVSGHGTAAAAIRVELPTDGTGQVVANAGTNLNTSALATEATLSTLNGKVTAVDTGAVVVASSALPTGAATAALQTQPGVDIGDVTVNNGAGAAAVNIQDGGNAITIDYATTGSGTATGALRVELPTNGTGVIATVTNVATIGTSVTPGTAAANLGKAEDAAHTTGDVGVFALGVANEAQSTLSADGDYIAQATDTKGNRLVVGNLAHDAADAGNPIKVGAKAADMGVTQTAVAANDRTNLFSDRSGVQFVIGGHPDVVTIEAAYAASAQTDTALVTVSAGTCIAVTQIQVVSDEATTVGVGFRVGFGTANTPTTTGVVLTHPGLVPGSGISRGDGGAIIGVGASNEDLRITAESATSGSIRVLVTYFTIAIG